MTDGARSITSGRFDIAEVAASLPPEADTLLVDHYLTHRPEASARVFRVYRGTPPHYHATCDIKTGAVAVTTDRDNQPRQRHGRNDASLSLDCRGPQPRHLGLRQRNNISVA